MVELLWGLGVLVLVVFAYMIKVVLDANNVMSASVARLEEKLSALEQAAVQVNSDVASLQGSLNDKVDKHYVEKRLDGLLALLKKRR